MKKIVFSIFTVVLLILASCGSKNANELLKTVPSDTDILAVVNIDNLNEKLKAEDKTSLDQLLIQTAGSSDESAKRTAFFLGEDSPVDFAFPLVGFKLNQSVVATFYVKDENAFREALEEKVSLKLTERGGLWVSDNNSVFMSGKQVWTTSEYPQVSVQDILTLTNLKESSSILSYKGVEKMLERDADLSLLANIPALLQYEQDLAMAGVGLNALFENAQYADAYVNFDSGKVEGGVSLLNDKGKVADMNIELKKIDVGELKKFNGKGNVFFALGIDSKLMKQVANQLKAFNLVPPNILNTIENLSGNAAASISAADPDNVAGQGVVSFNSDKAAKECRDILDNLSPSFASYSPMIRTEGKSLYVTVGQPTGSSFSAVADHFKNASIGFAIVSQGLESQLPEGIPGLIKGFYLTYNAKGSNPLLSFSLETKTGSNALVSILEALKKSNKY